MGAELEVAGLTGPLGEENLAVSETADDVGNVIADLQALETILETNELQQPRRPIMVVPFYPILSDKLRKLASNQGLQMWYTYPGRVSDQFTAFRGRTHPSKSIDIVYCVDCSCGLQYVGESSRNLKVRLSEHLHPSSNSAFSNHIFDDSRKKRSDHKPLIHQAQIIAWEKGTVKRRIIESLSIEHKRSRMCNTGVSVVLPKIWNQCAKQLAGQLTRTD